jgi:hypothetical protein
MNRVNKRCNQRANPPRRGRCTTNRTSASARKPRPSANTTAGVGSVAGAVLRSARRSARASRTRIAAASGVPENTIRAWEDGSSPLASAPMPRVDAVIAALHDAGACRLLTADLVVAAWCDLIIATVTASEDVTSLLADPLTAEKPFRELMAWCLEGRVPLRHRSYIMAGPLVNDQAMIERIRRILH